MNKQGPNGIEWTDFTWNPIGGCYHDCRWTMPDGTEARCYAKDVALGIAASAYPYGFEHIYWHPERLKEPSRIKKPSRIFLDSMSDLMGIQVPQENIEEVLATVEACYWHDFQLLTKNPGRLLKFADQLPANLWIGISMPPTHMHGKPLLPDQQVRYMQKTMDVFEKLYRDWRKPNVLWMSLEPLSFDVAPYLRPELLDWIVIGAASNGHTKYQPDPVYVQNVLSVAGNKVPVFFKGNLKWEPWQDAMPFEWQLRQITEEK